MSKLPKEFSILN